MRAGDVTAIIDTNVMVDVYSVADLTKAYRELGPGHDSPSAHFRRIRLREAYLLGWYLHLTGARTIGLFDEWLRILKSHAPPDDAATLEGQHVRMSIYLIKDRVLDRWHHHAHLDADANLKGTQCDDLVLELARRFHAPIITSEGQSIDGVSNADPRKLRARALRQGTEVYSPGQFWAGKMRDRAAHAFLARFVRKVPKWLYRQPLREPAKAAADQRCWIYEHVFFGRVSDGKNELPVRLPVRYPANATFDTCLP